MRFPLVRRSMLRRYLGYIVPSMVAFTLSCLYGICDGVFVGRAVGDAGLGAVNVAYPLMTFVSSLAIGCGMGGAVISSVRAGEGDEQASRRALGTAVLMLPCIGVPVALLIGLTARPLCALFGASGNILEQAVVYTQIIALGVPFQTVAAGGMPLVRNSGGVRYAMAVQVASGAINIALDAVLIFGLGMGIAGAAWATVVAQLFAFVCAVAFFVRRRHLLPREAFRADRHTVGRIARLGLAPFGLTLLPDATVVVVNVNCNLVGGEPAVAAYAVVSYVAFTVTLLVQGVGDGSQPLISRLYGEGKHDQVARLRNTNFLVAFALGVCGVALFGTLRWQIPALFGASQTAAAEAAFALPVYSLSYLFVAVSHPLVSYFYAVENSRTSTAIVVAEAVLVVVCVTGMGQLWGLAGIWWSIVVAHALLAAFSMIRLRQVSRG